MSSVINTNVKALTAQGSLNAVNNRMSQAMQRLSTGLRINSSKDDAAGLAITNKMTADIRGLAVAIRNANDGLSLAQTAEGAISSINGMLQRMRELAVQSANGTSSELARKGSQLEIEQLKQEINNISARTSFNGIKLLDGSAANLILQTGSEIGQTMNLQLDSVNTSNLGVGSRPSLSAVGAREAGQTTDAVGDVEANHQLQSGDLFINGVNVGTSLADSDTLSYSGKAASAIAKVAAINAVSASTGVKAVVNETYVSGAAMTGASDDGSIEINGFSVDVTADTNGDNGVTRGRVVTAINSISSQTGVMAMDTGDDNNGVVLVAKDGRNITVNVTGFNDGAAAVGLSAGTTTGNYSLQSISGNPIVLSSSSTGDITHAGLSSGSFKANSSVVTSGQRDVYTNAYDPDDAWSAGTLKINGVAISGTDPSSDTASDVTASSSSRSNSAIAIAAAINKASKLTGVSAVVSSNVIVGTDFNAEDLTGKSLFINGVTIDLEQVASDPTDYTRGQLADLINSYTGRTGVVASDNGRGITLTASDGRNISLGTDLGTTDGLGLTGARGMGTRPIQPFLSFLTSNSP
jgi:flagellin